MPRSKRAMVCRLTLCGNAFRRHSHVVGSRSDVSPSGERESEWFCLYQGAALPLSSITFEPCTTLLHGYTNPLKRLDTSESVNLHKRLILLDPCQIHATRCKHAATYKGHPLLSAHRVGAQ